MRPRIKGCNGIWVKHFQASFGTFTIDQVSRRKNTHVNSLATQATSIGESLPWVVIVENLPTLSHDSKTPILVNAVHVGPSWIEPVISFIKKRMLPKDRAKAKKIRRKAPRYWLFEEQKLYKCSYSNPYLLCIHPEVVETLLEELHEGVVVVTQGEGFCHTKLSLIGIGGPACISPFRSLLRSVTNAKVCPKHPLA